MCKILLVDDETIERVVLRKFLLKMDAFTVIGEADSGKSALEKFEELNPDIIVMDIKMPGIDGLEAAKIMKRINNDCVVIFLTAYVEAEKVQECIFSGGDAFLQKPVRENDLINTINRFRISEQKEPDPPDYHKLLIGQIIAKDYRQAKNAMYDLLKNRRNESDCSFADRKEAYLITATEIIETLKQLNLKNKESLGSGKELLNEATRINDAYLLQAWLFKVLDYAFHVILLEPQVFQDNEIKVVLNYLEKYYYKKITLEEVAEYVNISPFYLSKLFKRYMGVNFIDYLTDLKIEKAKELLEFTDMPVVNIAIGLSFNEPNYFTRVFRKTAGMTPSSYRETKRTPGVIVSRISDVKWYV